MSRPLSVQSKIPERALWLIKQASPCCTDSHVHTSSITVPADDERRCRSVGSHIYQNYGRTRTSCDIEDGARTSFGNPFAWAKNRVTPFVDVVLLSKSDLTYLFAQFHKIWRIPCGSVVTRKSLSFFVSCVQISNRSVFVAFSGGGKGTGTYAEVRRWAAGNI